MFSKAFIPLWLDRFMLMHLNLARGISGRMGVAGHGLLQLPSRQPHFITCIISPGDPRWSASVHSAPGRGNHGTSFPTPG